MNFKSDPYWTLAQHIAMKRDSNILDAIYGKAPVMLARPGMACVHSMERIVQQLRISGEHRCRNLLVRDLHFTTPCSR